MTKKLPCGRCWHALDDRLALAPVSHEDLETAARVLGWRQDGLLFYCPDCVAREQPSATSR